MAKHVITEDTIITEYGKSIPIGAYEKYFKEATGKELFENFHAWLGNQAGKTIKEALASFYDQSNPKTLEEWLSEERFNIISESDKAFIIAFDKEFVALGYDYGSGYLGNANGWPKYGMITYGKTGTKSRPCPARIYSKDSGEIVLRLYLSNIDKHRQYIEGTPPYIKNAFAFKSGDCKKCMATCKSMKIYTIDGQLYDKCCHSIACFYNPSVEKLPDYMNLYSEFNPAKKTKAANK